MESIDNQKLLPYEVIILDPDKKNKLLNFFKFKKFKYKLRLIKFRGDNYQGNKRNYGVKISKGNIIAFLDVKTLPKNDWLQNSYNLLQKEEIKYVFGSTRYFYNTFFQKILLFTTFGNINHETLPGTIMEKNFFITNGYFITNVISGEDLEMKERIKKNYFQANKSIEYNLEYSDLPKSIFPVLKKYFVYSIYNAFVEVQQNMKTIYLVLLLLFSSIIIPKWNYIIPNWSDNPMYIPNITKIYIIIITIIYLIFIIYRFITKKINNSNNFLLYFFNLFIFILIFTSVFYWNARIANWVENTIWYIPHITKIYVSSVLFISVFYRGIINPLKRKINLRELLPINWLLCGILGLFLDLVKSPGYIIGAIFLPILLMFKNKKNSKTYD